MSKDDPNWGKLNAYVDGELSPSESAEVAGAAARKPSVARAIAELHGLKGALDAAYCEQPIVIAIPHTALKRWWPRSLAASILLIVGVLVGSFLWQGRPHGDVGMFERLLSLHEEWHPSSKATSLGLAVWAGLQVPDLSAAGLAPAFVETGTLENVKVTHVGYLGRHGCRISLFVLPRHTEFEEELLPTGSEFLVSRWTNDADAFVAIARGFNEDRFATITEAFQLATTEPRPLSGTLRMALANAHQPCTT